MPTTDIVRARALLRELAVPDAAKRHRIPERVVHDVATQGVEQVLGVLGDIDPGHAGWSLLSCGMLLARNSASLEPTIEGQPAGESFSNGLVWAALVAAVAGDTLVPAVDDADPASTPPHWTPGPKTPEARTVAQRLVADLVDPLASPASRERFAHDARTQLDASLAGLDQAAAGWTLLTFGAWIASTRVVSASLTARRGIARSRATNRTKAVVGCSFAGALLAQIGLALVPNAGPTA